MCFFAGYLKKSGDTAQRNVASGFALANPKLGNIGISVKIMIKSSQMKLKEIEKIELVTHPQNTAALKLYSKYGFIVTGQKENYYGDGEPRLILTKVNKKKL